MPKLEGQLPPVSDEIHALRKPAPGRPRALPDYGPSPRRQRGHRRLIAMGLMTTPRGFHDGWLTAQIDA